MRIGPVLKWFGSKWQSAKHYPPPLPGLPLFEPYAGGAGYSLNYVDYDVTIWESNEQLLELWRWLIEEASQQQVMDIPLHLPLGTDIRTTGLNRGQQLLLRHWQRTNNYGNCWTISKWGSLSGQWTANTRARVSEEIQAIKHWKIGIPFYTEPATHFMDPPYFYNYKYGCKDFDYAGLVRSVSMPPPGSRVIVCEAICPKTGAIPNYLPFIPNHRSVTSRRKATQSHHSKELIYTRDV